MVATAGGEEGGVLLSSSSSARLSSGQPNVAQKNSSLCIVSCNVDPTTESHVFVVVGLLNRRIKGNGFRRNNHDARKGIVATYPTC
jgi:hypothetical protein